MTTRLVTAGAILIACLWPAGGGIAADFDAGMTAYRAGDHATAVREWLPLAEDGMVEAQFNLGLVYRKGLGSSGDPAEAVRWFRAAADAGFHRAQFNLGELYEDGAGVDRDLIQAFRWFKLAEHGKVPGARKRRKAAAKRMTPAEIALGELEYREWKRKRREER